MQNNFLTRFQISPHFKLIKTIVSINGVCCIILWLIGVKMGHVFSLFYSNRGISFHLVIWIKSGIFLTTECWLCGPTSRVRVCVTIPPGLLQWRWGGFSLAAPLFTRGFPGREHCRPAPQQLWWCGEWPTLYLLFLFHRYMYI